jgi:hypothetical protein
MRDLAIRNTHPNAVTIYGEKDALDKDGNVVVLDESKIKTEQDKLQAEYDALAYSRKREAEYPSLQECVHAILDDQLDALQAKRAEIKTKYPKGG